jgi:CheY-like chemotaxis protein
MGHRILIVDDEAAARFALRDFFTSRGYEVHCAASAYDAQVALRATTFSLIVTDLCLAGTVDRGGLAIIRYARAVQPQVKSILLTAYASENVERQLQAIGGDALLPKAVPLSVVADLVAELLGR